MFSQHIIDENVNNKKLLVGSIATNSHDVFRFTTGHTVYLSSTVLRVAKSQVNFLSINRSLFPQKSILLFMSLSLHVHGSM
jgi:hypothetical protein